VPRNRLKQVHIQTPANPTDASSVAPSRPTIAESTTLIRVVAICVSTTG
jgi:hypothetical protein